MYSSILLLPSATTVHYHRAGIPRLHLPSISLPSSSPPPIPNQAYHKALQCHSYPASSQPSAPSSSPMRKLPYSLILLIPTNAYHSCYSAHEHSSLPNLNPPSNTLPTDLRSTSTLSSLPLDISLETLLSVLLICIGLVLGAEELRPISWRVWAGKVERGMGPKGQEGFRALEKGRRRGFLDIRVSFLFFPFSSFSVGREMG